MRHGRDPVLTEHLRQRRRRYRPPAPHRKNETGGVAKRPRRVENVHGAPHPLLALRQRESLTLTRICYSFPSLILSRKNAL